MVDAGVTVEAEWGPCCVVWAAASLFAAPLPTARTWPLKETDSREDLPEAEVEVTEAD